MPKSLDDFLNEKIQEVNNFIKEGDLRKAHLACQEILEVDPENSKASRLIRKIEEQIRANNIKAVKKDIKNLEPLWKEQKYGELIEKYQKLLTYVPGYKPLEKLILKADKKFRAAAALSKKEFITNAKTTLQEFFNQKKYQEVIKQSQKIGVVYPEDSELQNLMRKFRIKVIDIQLADKKIFLASENYEKIIKYLYDLLKVEPTHKKLQTLIDKYKSRRASQQVSERRDYFFRGSENLKTLYQLKKYDKVIEGAQEMLTVDKKNTFAKSMLRKASRKLKRQIYRELHIRMKQARRLLRDEYQADKSKFIRL